MKLETPRLILRDLTESDLPRIVAYRSDPRYGQFSEGAWTEARVFLELQRHIEAQKESPRRNFALGIELKSNGLLIGMVGMRIRGLVSYGAPERMHEADIGYELDAEYWGKGYATEAGLELLRHCFEERGLHRVWAYCIADNQASKAVMMRLGMRQEARLRENELLNGEWQDTIICAILEQEWRRLLEEPGFGAGFASSANS